MISVAVYGHISVKLIIHEFCEIKLYQQKVRFSNCGLSVLHLRIEFRTVLCEVHDNNLNLEVEDPDVIMSL